LSYDDGAGDHNGGSARGYRPTHYIVNVPAIVGVHRTIAVVPGIFMQAIVSPERALMPRVARSSEQRVQGHSGRAGIMEGDEHATFPPLPGDRYPSAGHSLPDLRPHPRLPARQHQRGPDRGLPPGPSRSARPPRRLTESGLSAAREVHPRTPRARSGLAADLGSQGVGDHRASSVLCDGRAKSRRSARFGLISLPS
jgi:hypothetical protein